MTQASMLMDPASEVLPDGQAMHDLPFRYVSMGHLMTQAVLSVDPAGEVVPDGQAEQELGAFPNLPSAQPQLKSAVDPASEKVP
jgi:hypothetical protein